MTISLPDVNVLLALVAEGHVHHDSARKWFEARDNDSVGICRVTQVGLLRLLTNPRVLLSGSYSIPRAWDISNQLFADRRIFFEYEPPELEIAWMNMMKEPGTGPSSWTDAYLAAFAWRHEYEIVTFDKDFRRWTDLSFTLLVSKDLSS